MNPLTASLRAAWLRVYLLRYVYHFEDKRPVWRRAARQALLYNERNLDRTELEALRSDDPAD